MTEPATVCRLSHVLIRVADLAAAADYRALGFTVTFGSEPASARNAIVRLQGGVFLELFVTPPFDAAAHEAIAGAFGRAAADRFRGWAEAEEGLCDYCVEVDTFEIGPVVERIRADGVAISDAFPFQRLRPDGVLLEWRLAFPENLSLPFVMGAYRPPDTPSPGDLVHANGASELARLSLSRTDPDSHLDLLERLLGRPASTMSLSVGADETSIGLKGLTAPLATARLHGVKIALA